MVRLAPVAALPATTDTAGTADAAVDRISAFFETLSPESLNGIGAVYAPGARFKDPFNEVQGLAAIEQVYRHMFASLQQPRTVCCTPGCMP